MNKDNFVVDFQEIYFISDYKNFYGRSLKISIRNRLMILVLIAVIFSIINIYFYWPIIESIFFAALIFTAFSLLLKVYNLLFIKKNLIKSKNQFSFGRMNLTIEPTFIELHRYGRKRVIFISQLRKCILIKNILFFIETDKNIIPLKINKIEMTENSFNRLIATLEKLKIKIEGL